MNNLSTAVIHVHNGELHCPFDCQNVVVVPGDTDHTLQPLEQQEQTCIFSPGTTSSYSLVYKDYCSEMEEEEIQASNVLFLPFSTQCRFYSHGVTYIGTKNSVQFYVELMKTVRLSPSGNPILSVHLSDPLSSPLNSDRITCQSCTLSLLSASETYFEYEVRLTGPEARVFVEEGALSSILFQPNTASNIIDYHSSSNEMFSSEIECERRLDIYYNSLVVCEAVFGAAITIFDPDYISHSSGSIKSWAIISSSPQRSVVSFVFTSNALMEIYLLFGAASREDGSRSLESNTERIDVASTRFSTALSILSTDAEVCLTKIVRMRLGTEGKAVGVSEKAFSMQGLTVIEINRTEDE